jgi:hypothetical protein
MDVMRKRMWVVAELWMGMMAMTPSCHAAVPHGVNKDVHFFPMPMSGSWNGTAVNFPSMSYYQVRISLTPQQEDADNKWRLQWAPAGQIEVIHVCVCA